MAEVEHRKRALLLARAMGNRAAARVLSAPRISVQREVSPDIAPGSKVICINSAEPFYLAVGTVRGKASEREVNVRFDFKPRVSYTVPVIDLDPHDAARRFYDLSAALANPTFSYASSDSSQAVHNRTRITGVPSLLQFLRENEGTVQDSKWAFTGSVALSVWAHHYEVPFRHPHDMDIVVRNMNGWHYVVGVAVSGQPGAPSQTANHRTTHLGLYTLDILQDGGGLGEFGGGVWTVDGTPVVGLETIRKYKERRSSGEDHTDIQVIDALIAKRAQH